MDLRRVKRRQKDTKRMDTNIIISVLLSISIIAIVGITFVNYWHTNKMIENLKDEIKDVRSELHDLERKLTDISNSVDKISIYSNYSHRPYTYHIGNGYKKFNDLVSSQLHKK